MTHANKSRLSSRFGGVGVDRMVVAVIAAGVHDMVLEAAQ